MFTCAFLNCGTTLSDKNLSFYLFPVDDEEIHRKWIDALGYPENKPYIPHKDNFICSKHFDPEDIEDGILKPNAVPLKDNNNNNKKSKEKIEDLNDFDICRICGKAKEMLMIDIFDDDLEICEKIGLCLPIVINPNDNLPQTICDECSEQLDVAANLIRKCLTGEEKLNLLFGNDKLAEKRSQTVLPLFGPIVCDKCQVYFSDMSLFDAHMIEHEEASKPVTDVPEKPSIACSSCGHIYPDWKHYEAHKSPNACSPTCNLCGETFMNKCFANIHKCHKFKCEYCGLIFKSEPLIKKHIAKAHQTSKMIHKLEPEIDLEVTDMPDIKPNIGGKKHGRTRKELYHCNICDIKFTSNKKLRDHCIEYHGTPNVLWICKFCGKSMTTKVSLQIHERIHFDSKPYICEWCGNGYRSRANLNQHQVIHTGVRNHECPKCGKRFSRKAFVRTHMRVHTGERPYVCDICGHRFTQLGDMKRHRNRHQNPHVPAYPSDRVYACDFCGEQFTQLSMLKKHRLEHSSQHHQPAIVYEDDEDQEDTKEMTIEIEQMDQPMMERERERRKRHRSE